MTIPWGKAWKHYHASRLAWVFVLALAFAGCAGRDAVNQGGTFNFVSPGGQREIFYDPPESRGTPGLIAGRDLMTDKPLSLNDFTGKAVVLNIWGQWCGPCRGETAGLERAYGQTKSLGVEFLGINVRDPIRDKPRDFVTDNKVSYRSIYDPSMRSLAALGANFPVSVIPATIVLDRQHRVAAVYLKPLLDSELRSTVERIARES